MFLVLLFLFWALVQLAKPRLERLSTRSTSLNVTRFSLQFDTTSLNSLPSRLIDWLPRVRWHTRRDKRRLSTLWDVGALVALIGGVVAQGVLLLAVYRAVGALWSIITSTEAAPALSAGLVKRAPVDVVPPPSSEVSPAQDLLLRPLIPSFSSLPLVVFALVLSQGFHELGHALAAASDSLPLLSVGFHLYFPLLLPTFYVALPSASSSLSFEAGTSPLTDLRLATAGVWHNLLLVGGAWAMAESGLGVGGALAEAVGAVERVEEGVVVDEVDKTSPLYQHLPRGTLITHLDDLELDASTSFSGSTLDLWKDYLRPDSPRAKNPYSDMGWCLSANLFTETAACCSTLTANDTASGSDAVKPELCFESTSNSTTPMQQSCLDPLTLLSPSSPLPPRCIDASSCASHSGTVCARSNPREQVLRLGVRKAGAARMVVGERATVLWQGRREGVLQHVHVTSIVPRWRILPLGLALTFERIYQLIVSLSLSLAFFNLLPLPHLDGSHILSSFLISLVPSFLPLTRTSIPSSDMEFDILATVVTRLGKVGPLRRAAQEREKWEKRIRRWTMLVGGIALGATVVVELMSWIM